MPWLPSRIPPRPQLQYGDVAGYAMLVDFELLKHSDANVLSRPWSVPANCLVATKYFKILRAWEEIICLNVESRRLCTWVDNEDRHMLRVSDALQASEPALAHEIHIRYLRRRRVNNIHRAHLHALCALPGYTGHTTPGTHVGVSQGTDDQGGLQVEGELNDGGEEMDGHEVIEIFEDDLANEEVLRLGDVLENTHVY